jgi:hypothetical protein
MNFDELTMAVLDDEVREREPRLFAIYGVYRTRLDEHDDGSFLAYGMEFDEPPLAISWEGGSTRRSDSVASMLRRLRARAEVKLVWLHDPGKPEQADYDLAAE